MFLTLNGIPRHNNDMLRHRRGNARGHAFHTLRRMTRKFLRKADRTIKHILNLLPPLSYRMCRFPHRQDRI